jgi:hypothetical protein
MNETLSNLLILKITRGTTIQQDPVTFHDLKMRDIFILGFRKKEGKQFSTFFKPMQVLCLSLRAPKTYAWQRL